MRLAEWCRTFIPSDGIFNSHRTTLKASWCRTVIPSDRIFNSHRTTIMDSFSCVLFLPQLHVCLNLYYFKISNESSNNDIFRSRDARFGSYLRRWLQNVRRKMTSTWHQDVKHMSKTTFWRHARESSYTPHVRRHFLALVGFTEILVGYARIFLFAKLLK